MAELLGKHRVCGEQSRRRCGRIDSCKHPSQPRKVGLYLREILLWRETRINRRVEGEPFDRALLVDGDAQACAVSVIVVYANTRYP